MTFKNLKGFFQKPQKIALFYSGINVNLRLFNFSGLFAVKKNVVKTNYRNHRRVPSFLSLVSHRSDS